MTSAVKICAHRGLSAFCPENTLPAFAAALALGADEIELDVRLTRDNQMIISHDDRLDRISDGTGLFQDHTLAQLQALNAGAELGWIVSFTTPDEVFSLLGDRIGYNLHLKGAGNNGSLVRMLTDCIHHHGLEKRCYFAGFPEELEWMERVSPHIARAAIQYMQTPEQLVQEARRYHCAKVQLWAGRFEKSDINHFHELGISCNLFYADTVADMLAQAEAGIDTLLTNRCDLAMDFRKRFQN